ncbi:LCM-domain-containing protein [Trichoderma citrinoviride]|uniref:tRNA wybutosine-synthesizing protein 4 n=1 Tax=Trichoderma citrinoviride TaxID=58853 RepID=A0A2T4AXE7_9HYPO|nr:LCM-domain-containing protein [Trichoderma citrinoviride]PTB61757.1 LCM-domain-containing protein [Trichoderma citrinoviride]
MVKQEGCPGSQTLDDMVMGTNNSSIASKRSVERLYHSKETPFFRYFVPKFQRRAPLINRGYWLRLRAIDVIVQRFLSKETAGKKLVINLDLIHKKRAVVLQTPELRELLGDDYTLSDEGKDGLLLRSTKYCQLGCDLRQLDRLRTLLGSIVSLPECAILFVAEVSITYMDTHSADALIEWGSTVGRENNFCLLEQILPYGNGHPFAQQMLSHFAKLNTPLRSVETYPTIESQVNRFQERGWPHVDIKDLWQTWSSEEFVSDFERVALDDVEPFDEWEEFILFARHYFILHAATDSSYGSFLQTAEPITGQPPKKFVGLRAELSGNIAKETSRRRFGSGMILSNEFGQRFALNLLGMSGNSREPTYDIFSLASNGQTPPQLPSAGPSARMCFTLTDLGEYGVMLVGGRTSPSNVLSDCWLFERGANPRWRMVPKLPVPLFRHSALRLGNSSLLVVFGGKKSSSQLSDDVFLFNPQRACWQICQVTGPAPESCFGSFVCNSIPASSITGDYCGILAGGISKNGCVATKHYMWRINVDHAQPTISYRPITISHSDSRLISSFGAQVVHLGSNVMICGGMGADSCLNGQTLTTITPSAEGFEVKDFSTPSNGERMPFMIGSSMAQDGDSLLVFGGGATCFSMGTFWETGVYRIRLPDSILDSIHSISRINSSPGSTINLIGSRKFVAASTTADLDDSDNLDQKSRRVSLTPVPTIQLESAEQFGAIVREGKPVILKGCNIGQCQRKWSPEFLVSQIGANEKFVIHESYEDTGALDFNSKNFKYVTDSFGSIMSKLQSGSRVYLRALSRDKPTELPAKLEEDFPSLAEDFALPPEMALIKDNLFSSVLRLSGRVNMWLHYDVMANVYAQVAGVRKMILFPPSDVKHLSFAPGASSSSVNVFQALEASPASLHATHPQEAVLHPGDVLLLPALWLHTAAPISDMSIAVNVFFRDPGQKDHYSSGRDVYGNRDLEVYEKGRQAVARIAKSLQSLPPAAREFYLCRLQDELRLATEA